MRTFLFNLGEGPGESLMGERVLESAVCFLRADFLARGFAAAGFGEGGISEAEAFGCSSVNNFAFFLTSSSRSTIVAFLTLASSGGELEKFKKVGLASRVFLAAGPPFLATSPLNSSSPMLGRESWYESRFFMACFGRFRSTMVDARLNWCWLGVFISSW